MRWMQHVPPMWLFVCFVTPMAAGLANTARLEHIKEAAKLKGKQSSMQPGYWAHPQVVPWMYNTKLVDVGYKQ